MNDKMVIWLTVLGSVIVAALVSFFNMLFRLPLGNKARIDKLEVKMEYAIEAIEKEQKMNKDSHKEILKTLTQIQDQINKIAIKLAKMESKDEVGK